MPDTLHSADTPLSSIFRRRLSVFITFRPMPTRVRPPAFAFDDISPRWLLSPLPAFAIELPFSAFAVLLFCSLSIRQRRHVPCRASVSPDTDFSPRRHCPIAATPDAIIFDCRYFFDIISFRFSSFFAIIALLPFSHFDRCHTFHANVSLPAE